MAEYEEVVNELAQQLEDMTTERDELVGSFVRTRAS